MRIFLTLVAVLFVLVNLTFADEPNLQISYFWSMPWNTHTIDFSVDNGGSFYAHDITYDNSSGREQKNYGQGRLTSDEYSQLRNNVLALNLAGLAGEYNNCATDLPSTSVTFNVDNKKTVVTVYEVDETLAKSCKEQKPPQALADVLRQLKALVEKYHPNITQ